MPAPGSNGSGLANTATIARTKIKVGMDSVTLKYMVMTESIQPRRYAAMIPKAPPISDAASTETNEITSDILVP
ncbi:unannotated protein [freshwater metagenome]|uniref:Unannotated protein n=1 Tax=freshwater metagenome TaxID=449393 RepID=A0A6J6K7M9_9ZZZZ